MRCDLIIIVASLLVSCAAKPQIQDDEVAARKDTYKSVAVSRLTGSPEYITNEAKTHVIAFTKAKSTALRPQNTLRFIVIDLASNNVIYDESLIDGSVRWLDNDRVEIVLYAEVARKDESANKVTTLLDIHSLKKTNPTNNQP